MAEVLAPNTNDFHPLYNQGRRRNRELDSLVDEHPTSLNYGTNEARPLATRDLFNWHQRTLDWRRSHEFNPLGYPHRSLPTHLQPISENERPHLRPHSLSPERLGVTGYVRDVASLVREILRDGMWHRVEGVHLPSDAELGDLDIFLAERMMEDMSEHKGESGEGPQGVEEKSNGPKVEGELRSHHFLVEGATKLFPHVYQPLFTRQEPDNQTSQQKK
ncbi:uncharacterized protein VTP21DRAFT_11591 [Calcarisporiella thermophila]|uniref:uncharacterized protein n=1 Tax=Calcarisporiella thermophila TaxID=911321 RepID=UPI00374374C1